MNGSYYTDEYYHAKRGKYYTDKFNADLAESFLHAYSAFCGTVLVDSADAKVPIIAFWGMSFAYLGKSLYDLYKAANIDYRWANNKGLTEPIKIRKLR